MLTRLVVQNIVLIDHLSIDLAGGLNVFTGETGAGKSIVLDAIGLALGGRGDVSMIREGADQASVTACFSAPLPPPLLSLMEEQGLSVEDPFILRRTLSRDGKSRAFAADQPIGIGLLKQIGERLLEVHGQFDTHGLLNPSTHRGFLDSFGGLEGLSQKTAEAYQQWEKARRDYADALALQQQAAAEGDFLRASVDELKDLAPDVGEVEKLSDKRKNLQNREKIIEALKIAGLSLDGDHGAVTSLATAGKALARLSDRTEQFSPLLQAIDRLTAEVEEVALQLNSQLYACASDEDTLESIEERLFALRAIARKHRIAPEELPSLLSQLSARLDLITGGVDQANRLAGAVVKARRAYEENARALFEKREKAAAKLTQKVMKELPPLKLEKARFMVEVALLPDAVWGPAGMDRVAFLVATNPGSAAGPLQKVASGGELSRFMLALKLVLASADPVPVLVFDEVDAGIGGATASAVGERLARLAKQVQIMVVTHSPQVAARGQNHWRVEKTVKGKTTTTNTVALSPEDRVEEIARMISGSQVTDIAKRAAQSLLSDAS